MDEEEKDFGKIDRREERKIDKNWIRRFKGNKRNSGGEKRKMADEILKGDQLIKMDLKMKNNITLQMNIHTILYLL